MNNLKLGQRVIAVLVVAVGLLSSSAPSDVLRLEVTYTNGGVDFGPICGVPSLPTEVCAKFTFQGHPCADNVVAADNALVTALIEFGDATWTEADVNFFAVCYSGGVVFEFNYQLLPITTGMVLNIEAANFPLTISGTCIADGQDFQYTYTDSSSVLTVPCPADINTDATVNVLDLIELLLCFGQPAVPGCEPEDVNGDGTVNVLDLIDLLLAFGDVCEPWQNPPTSPVAVLYGDSNTIGVGILGSEAWLFTHPERYFLDLRLQEFTDGNDLIFLAEQQIDLVDVELLGAPLDGAQFFQVQWTTAPIAEGSFVETCVQTYRRWPNGCFRPIGGNVCDLVDPQFP